MGKFCPCQLPVLMNTKRDIFFLDEKGWWRLGGMNKKGAIIPLHQHSCNNLLCTLSNDREPEYLKISPLQRS